MKGFSKRMRVAGFFALSFVLFSIQGHAAICRFDLPSLEGEWQEYREGEFIAQYSLAGRHALKNPIDSQVSGVPDVVADALAQLVVMRELLKQMKFQLPLESSRYQGQGASHIVVRFRKLHYLNGQAFDEVRRLPSGECVLIIDLDSRYSSGNLTPAHELFHQVQNGYAPFKRPWFYEGTARWSETILGKSAVVARPIPDNAADTKLFWEQSYAAASVWYGLIERCNQQSAKVAVPDHLRAQRYRSGRPVILDDDIPGHDFIRQVLEELSKLGDRVTQTEGLKPYRWPESTQRDPRYDEQMWAAIQGC